MNANVNQAMNTTSALRLLLPLLLFSTVSISPPLLAQGTAFTYQGRLNINGNPANGIYDFRFRVASDPLANNYVGSSLLTNGFPLSNGLFTVTLDFGGGIFTGSNYWLEVDVRTNGIGSYTMLNPLQAFTPTPYAIFAETASNLSGTVSSANLAGDYSGPVTFNNTGNSFAGNGSGLAGVNAATLDGLNASNFWITTGNVGTTAGVNFIGTTDNQPLELHVNGRRVARLEQAPENNSNISNAVNFIQGSSANFVAPGVHGATIAGGGADFYFGGNVENMIASDYGTISGGIGNQIQTNAYESTIAGGNANFIYPGAYRSMIAGGWYNQIETNADHTFIAGGFNNTAFSSYNAIGGGHYNVAGNTNYNASEATVAGGAANTASGVSSFIGGGAYNLAYNNNAVVAGGLQNRAGYHAFVGSGYQNSADGEEAAIGGGRFNSVDTNSFDSTIGGGYQNLVSNSSYYAFIGGGQFNNIISGQNGMIGGGYGNKADGDYTTVGGGIFNDAGANFAVVVGGGGNMANGSAAFVGGGGIHEVGNGIFYLNGNTASGAATVVGGGLTMLPAAREQLWVVADLMATRLPGIPFRPVPRPLAAGLATPFPATPRMPPLAAALPIWLTVSTARSAAAQATPPVREMPPRWQVDWATSPPAIMLREAAAFVTRPPTITPPWLAGCKTRIMATTGL
jgi:trimeric autotransporter adhesin